MLNERSTTDWLLKQIPETERSLPVDLVVQRLPGVRDPPDAFPAIPGDDGPFDGSLGSSRRAGPEGSFQTWCAHAEFHNLPFRLMTSMTFRTQPNTVRGIMSASCRRVPRCTLRLRAL